MFIDKSIFQGIKEFTTPAGEMKFEGGGGVWSCHRDEKKAWIFCGNIMLKKANPTPEQLFSAWNSLEEKE